MRLKQFTQGAWFPWLVAGFVLVTFVSTFFSLQRFSRLNHRDIEQEELRYLTGLAESCYQQHVDGLVLESMLATSVQMERASFARFSETTHKIFKAFLAINRIDKNGVIVQVYPVNQNQAALGADLLQHKAQAVRESVKLALSARVVANTPPVTLIQGGMGMALYIPQIRQGAVAGLINGVFRFDDFLKVCLKNTPEFFQRMNLTYQGQELLDREPLDGAILLTEPVRLGDHDMDLTIQNVGLSGFSSSTIAHYTILGLGFLASIIIAVLLRRSEEMRRRAQENEDATEQLYNQIHVAVFILQRGRICRPNETTMAMTGYSAEELASANFLEFLHPDDKERVASNHRRRIMGDKDLPGSYEIRIINKSGLTIWVYLDTGVITWRGEPATLNVLRDISEVKTLQAQILESERMEIQGLMASGLAHDFNNILTSIGGCTEMLLMDHDVNAEDEGHESLQMLKTIQEQVASASNLTRQLLGLATGSAHKIEVLELDLVVSSTMALFQRTHKGITIKLHNHAGQAVIEADRGQIEQILLNLLVNADNVLQGKGSIVIFLDQMTLDKAEAILLSVSPGTFYRLAVEDSGPGIPHDLRQKIFQPFFTKATGNKKGTGLGLASGYSIARAHGGSLGAMDSEQLGGARLELYLPASSAALPKTTTAQQESTLCAKFVAIVDDEYSVSTALCNLLERHGCTTANFDAGDRFLAWLSTTDRQPELVILDMIMPGMDGLDVFRAIRKKSAHMPVLVSTGYARDDLVKEILSQPYTDMITKPYSISGLIASVNKLTDETEPRR